jgi:hypothetical protein
MDSKAQGRKGLLQMLETNNVVPPFEEFGSKASPWPVISLDDPGCRFFNSFSQSESFQPVAEILVLPHHHSCNG